MDKTNSDFYAWKSPTGQGFELSSCKEHLQNTEYVDIFTWLLYFQHKHF